ncbi:hypothetical protein PUNSTDRAFT_138047 [Punctularia strigosozonata HHB-11173 SS5]|uniref:Velvet domain-containing protein n=1 Tax=Punctularia strigosozonata (strain HHB-11173) TaxID=741275 RepID=R7S3R7_PUNST|nr:uncharacterized protein PUNSTDRAFT_138047 [Punctularia strigosozonata HHB-11173 SS5]EIN04848.1 hypothetical protein PUNSTDRAFT_138047 [Punctularia strigosozonata HHB-11173 SS5]
MSPMGRPVAFAAGTFSGLTVRTELREIQAAEVARKAGTKEYTSVMWQCPDETHTPADRRPLDPPPILVARFFVVDASAQWQGEGSATEKEIRNTDDVRVEGFVCNVDLFPMSSDWRHGEPVPATLEESAKCTENLSGSRFAEAIRLEYGGAKSVMFPFPDLSVTKSGYHLLRYRIFNVLSIAAGTVPVPALAECYGGVFHVYGSKEFPGLRASTDLTKVCAPVPPSFPPFGRT